MTLIIQLIFFVSISGFAGHESGNGGGGVVCRDSAGKVSTVQLLDFWEAETLRQWKILGSGSTLERIRVASQKFGIESKNLPLSSRIIERARHILNTKMTFVSDVGIATPRDIMNRFVKKGCPIEGIASFDDVFQKVDVDQELYERLPERDRAGLIFHEAVYYELRRAYGVENSNLARFITGCSFSDGQCPELNPAHEEPKESTACHTANANFSVFSIGSELRLQFLEVDGNESAARAYFDLDPSLGCVLQQGTLVCSKKLEKYHAFLRSSEDRTRDVGSTRKFQVRVDASGTLVLDSHKVVCGP